MNVTASDYARAPVSQSRRRFLRGTLAGSCFLLVGSGARVPAALRQSASASGSLVFFDEFEFNVFKAIADRIIGPRMNDAPSLDEIAHRADAFLSVEHPEIQEQFHLLLTLFNSAWIATLFDLRFSSFLNMSPETKDAYIRDWMQSPLSFRRTAFQGLKKLSMSVFYTHAGSWEKIGFDGEYGSV